MIILITFYNCENEQYLFMHREKSIFFELHRCHVAELQSLTAIFIVRTLINSIKFQYPVIEAETEF